VQCACEQFPGYGRLTSPATGSEQQEKEADQKKVNYTGPSNTEVLHNYQQFIDIFLSRKGAVI
jgi:hypothetical protein